MVPIIVSIGICIIATIVVALVYRETAHLKLKVQSQMTALENSERSRRQVEAAAMQLNNEFTALKEMLGSVVQMAPEESFTSLSQAITSYTQRIFPGTNPSTYQHQAAKRFWSESSGTDVRPEAPLRVTARTRTEGPVLDLLVPQIPEKMRSADMEPRLIPGMQLVTLCVEHHSSRANEIRAAVEKSMGYSLRGLQNGLIRPLPNVPGMVLACHFAPSLRVGGDWLSCHYIRERGVLRFFLGDVTGTGIASVNLSAISSGAIHFAQSLASGALAEPDFLKAIVERLNYLVFERGAGEHGMTLLCGSLNLKTGELVLANLGNPHPLLVHFGTSDKKAQPILSSNPELGSLDFALQRIKTITLSPGQGLFMFTDGLAVNCGKHLDFREVYARAGKADSPSAILTEVESHYQDVMKNSARQPADDVAMLAFQWLGPS